MKAILIDTTEVFPHLARAPIVEAVVDLRARAEEAWKESDVSTRLKPKLADYPNVQSQREYEFTIQSGSSPESKTLDLGWKGLRFDSSDGRHIAQFNRDGFVFSRLAPYEDWTQLVNEAFRLWEIHIEVAGSTQVERIGVRFINKIDLPQGELEFEKYLLVRPEAPKDFQLPFGRFFHQDTLVVPGHPYAINVIRALQQSVAGEGSVTSLILDIDVYTTTGPLRTDSQRIRKHLSEMRWLKNKVFFGSVTSDALEDFK